VSELLKIVTSGVIAHQVNCMGVMGSGVAARIQPPEAKLCKWRRNRDYVELRGRTEEFR
jgi:hypothetical protein